MASKAPNIGMNAHTPSGPKSERWVMATMEASANLINASTLHLSLKQRDRLDACMEESEVEAGKACGFTLIEFVVHHAYIRPSCY